jgi:hypothetical protein
LSIALTHTIVATGMLSFDYSLTLHETGQFEGANYGAYTLDGTMFRLQPGNGSVDIPVTAGDTFGFVAYATSKCITCVPSFGGAASLTIDHFNAPVPNPVPEPATTALLICGGALFARERARRKSKRLSA